VNAADLTRAKTRRSYYWLRSGWRWLHTPGHSPGRVSLWRRADRLVIAGDAFVTTRQESVYSAVTQAPELHGPPMYFTPDWPSARQSVLNLAALGPDTVVTGHGQAMQGPEMRSALAELAERFDEVAVPKHGQYVPALFVCDCAVRRSRSQPRAG
jgi:glyoxylase-like metal-dependent hydrolase (beta-lactamase superfamily II)